MQGNQGYIERPCFKTKNEKKNPRRIILLFSCVSYFLWWENLFFYILLIKHFKYYNSLPPGNCVPQILNVWLPWTQLFLGCFLEIVGMWKRSHLVCCFVRFLIVRVVGWILFVFISSYPELDIDLTICIFFFFLESFYCKLWISCQLTLKILQKTVFENSRPSVL